MKRILIVEDEFLVRIGLKTTIDWSAHGYVIVGEAANGKDALLMFDEVNPDILITDVRMPVMDGLQLVQQAKLRKKDLQVVILSNHGDFEYAREAMRLGANQYLLKSEINEAKLLQVLEALVVDAEKTNSEVADQKALQEQVLRKYFNVVSMENEHANKSSATIKAAFTEKYYIAMRCYSDFGVTEEVQGDAGVKSIESMLQSVLEDALFTTVVGDNHLTMSVLCPVLDAGNALEAIGKKCGLIIRNAGYYFDSTMAIGISSVGSGEMLYELFSQAEQARVHCFFTGMHLEFFGAIVPNDTPAAVKISSRKITAYLETKDRQSLEDYIGESFSLLLKNANFSQVRKVYIDFLAIAKSICETKGLDMTAGLSGEKFDYDSLRSISSLKHARDYVSDLYGVVYNGLWGNGQQYSHTIKQCLAYIESNFGSNISLDNMSSAVNISKNYLSMIFKQEMGINFINYLTQYRIERAKELLRSTHLKIYEVAELVGFSTPYYFSKVFKDWTKMSCKEYKDQFSVALSRE